MKTHRGSSQIVAVLFLLLSVSITPAFGQAFRAPVPGVFGIGRAGGKIAHVDDASAVTHNPANLVELSSAEVEIDPQLLYIKSEFTTSAAVGGSTETRSPWKLLPSVWAGTPMPNSPIWMGLGITVPWGVSMDYQGSGLFNTPAGTRYTTADRAELIVTDVSPTVAVQINDDLQIGAGIDVMHSKLELHQYFPWFLFVPGSPDGDATIKADGVGVGGNVGATWEFAKGHRIAATYRSPVRVEHDGDFKINNIPAALGGGETHSEFETVITFPTVVTVGYGVQVTETLRLETDVEWVQFSTIDDLPLAIKQPSPPAGIPANIRQDFSDCVNVGVAGDWSFAKDWRALFSYKHFQRAVPSYTYIPTIPDSDMNAGSLGVQYRKGHHRLGLVGTWVAYDDRTVSDNQLPALNGTYETTVFLITASYGFAF